jgi:hypothetical protein
MKTLLLIAMLFQSTPTANQIWRYDHSVDRKYDQYSIFGKYVTPPELALRNVPPLLRITCQNGEVQGVSFMPGGLVDARSGIGSKETGLKETDIRLLVDKGDHAIASTYTPAIHTFHVTDDVRTVFFVAEKTPPAQRLLSEIISAKQILVGVREALTSHEIVVKFDVPDISQLKSGCGKDEMIQLQLLELEVTTKK